MGYINFLISLILSLGLSGCAFYTPEVIQPAKPVKLHTGIHSTPFQAWNKNFESWNKKHNIHLLPHQRYPIFYLETHPKQLGLVINQGLGTGKTFLAIGFAERNPKHSVVILGPKFLHSHWLEHLDQYSVQDKNRYRFISHDNCEILLKEDLSKTIVIIDESHRLIEKVRFGNPQYSRLYSRLKKSYKLLSLSATPIYTDMFDLVYQVNLVAGKELLSFNQEAFRKQFLQTKRWTAYWRGHVMETNFLLSMFIANTFHCLHLPIPTGFNAGALYGYLGGFAQVLLKVFMPLYSYPLTEFKPADIEAIVSTYFSHYEIQDQTDNNQSEYPKNMLYLQTIDYSTAQLKFLYKFYDSQLRLDELSQLLKDSSVADHEKLVDNDDYIRLNNSRLQDAYKSSTGAGREIGNLTFYEPKTAVRSVKSTHATTQLPSQRTADGTKVHPPKFEQVLKTIMQSQGPVVVYSHYYYNGLLLFKQFLEDKGYQGQYRIFHPEMSREQQAQIINEFNKGQIKILLLHPSITEGISLKGTQQLHFLEVPINRSLQQQISGRAIRYQSHQHLPLHQRKVHIYIWQHNITWYDWRSYTLHRRNWQENFCEFDYYSTMGAGRIQYDANAPLKDTSPDIRSYAFLNMLNEHTETFRGYLKKFSIENIHER